VDDALVGTMTLADSALGKASPSTRSASASTRAAASSSSPIWCCRRAAAAASSTSTFNPGSGGRVAGHPAGAEENTGTLPGEVGGIESAGHATSPFYDKLELHTLAARRVDPVRAVLLIDGAERNRVAGAGHGDRSTPRASSS
jgi:hypothetical protein